MSEEGLPIEKFFTEDTISVHLKVGAPPMAKRGYITEVKFEQVEEENIKKLREERDSKIKELDILKKTTPEAMWESELNTLLIQYKLYRQNRINRNKGTPKRKRIIKKKKGKAKIKINK